MNSAWGKLWGAAWGVAWGWAETKKQAFGVQIYVRTQVNSVVVED